MGAMRLWRVFVECEMVVASETEPTDREAKRHLRDGMQDGGVPCWSSATEISSPCELDKEWLRALPYGGDGRKCEEYLR
jgi:hypothetical protein